MLAKQCYSQMARGSSSQTVAKMLFDDSQFQDSTKQQHDRSDSACNESVEEHSCGEEISRPTQTSCLRPKGRVHLDLHRAQTRVSVERVDA